MVSTPILAMPNFSIPFTIEADTFGYGLGAVLLQNGHPIAFFSKVLGPRARTHSIYEKELMELVLAVQKWKHFLLGQKFEIRTDQQSLKFVMELREVGSEYQCWVSKLMGYNFEIRYKPGSANKVADALSREYVSLVELGELITYCGVQWTDIQKHIQEDVEI